MKKFAPGFLLVTLLSVTAFAQNAQQNLPAQDKDALPNNFLHGKHIKYAHSTPAGLHAAKKMPNAASLSLNAATNSSSCKPQSSVLACVDTITNFNSFFKEQGVYLDGTSRDIWQFSLVGKPPSTNAPTVFNAPVIPVTINMLNADGTPRSIVTNKTNCPNCTPSELGKTVRLIYRPQPFLQTFLNSPVFKSSTFSSSPVPTQVTDAVQRSEFGAVATEHADWHTLLAPSLKNGQTMALLGGTYFFSLNNDGSCCAFVLVDETVFGEELFPPTAPPDNSTVIGQAEVSGAITTRDISTFFFPNTYLYSNGNPNNCCVLGFHSFDFEPGDATNGNRTRFYVMNYSSWISPGLFADPTCAKTNPDHCFQDVTAHSHEIAEIFNDPFVGYDGIHNITPFWLNPAGQCQDIMEVGDVIEDLPNPTYPVTINGFAYHPQTEALLPWFEFKSPSTALHNAYSYPNETALTALSAPQPLNCAGK
jgi:hypothetical protein